MLQPRETTFETFQKNLENYYSWPALYMFKFIAPLENVPQLLKMFDKQEVETRASKNGNYISVTAKSMMISSDHVIEVYKEAGEIEGIISL